MYLQYASILIINKDINFKDNQELTYSCFICVNTMVSTLKLIDITIHDKSFVYFKGNIII